MTWVSMKRGEPVRIGLAERNLLAAGEPGAGKSVGLNLIVAHAAFSLDCRLILVDGKRVELGLRRRCAEAFIVRESPTLSIFSNSSSR